MTDCHDCYKSIIFQKRFILTQTMQILHLTNNNDVIEHYGCQHEQQKTHEFWFTGIYLGHVQLWNKATTKKERIYSISLCHSVKNNSYLLSHTGYCWVTPHLKELFPAGWYPSWQNTVISWFSVYGGEGDKNPLAITGIPQSIAGKTIEGKFHLCLIWHLFNNKPKNIFFDIQLVIYRYDFTSFLHLRKSVV